MHTIEQKIKRYAEKQKSMTCTQEKRQVIETALERAQISYSVHTGFKSSYYKYAHRTKRSHT